MGSRRCRCRSAISVISAVSVYGMRVVGSFPPTAGGWHSEATMDRSACSTCSPPIQAVPFVAGRRTTGLPAQSYLLVTVGDSSLPRRATIAKFGISARPNCPTSWQHSQTDVKRSPLTLTGDTLQFVTGQICISGTWRRPRSLFISCR